MRRAKKALRDELIELLEVKVKEKNTGKKVTTQKAISAALVRQAMTGNTKAFEIIRDTIGEKPVEKVEQMIDIDYRNSVEYVKRLMDGVEE